MEEKSRKWARRHEYILLITATPLANWCYAGGNGESFHFIIDDCWYGFSHAYLI